MSNLKTSIQLQTATFRFFSIPLLPKKNTKNTKNKIM